MLFVFVVTLLGLSSSYRIFVFLNHQSVFSKQQLTKIGTAYLFFISFALISFNFSRILYFTLIFTPQILIFGISFVIQNQRKRSFKNNFLIFLENLLLKMYIGNSFRESFNLSKPKLNIKYINLMNQIEEFVVFPQRNELEIKDMFIREIIKFFRKVDSSSHNCVARMEFYYQQSKLMESFRRKSSVITTQTRMQTIVLSILYVALAIYQLSSFGFIGNEFIFLTSVSFYFVGLMAYVYVYKRNFS